MQNTTIAAIATAPGAGGIAVVRLSGPERRTTAMPPAPGAVAMAAIVECSMLVLSLRSQIRIIVSRSDEKGKRQKAPFQFSTGRGQHCAKLSGVYSSILPKLKSAKSSTRSVRLGATGAAVSASRGA